MGTLFIAMSTAQAKGTPLITNGTSHTIDLCPGPSQVIIGHRSAGRALWRAGAVAGVLCKPHAAYTWWQQPLKM